MTKDTQGIQSVINKCRENASLLIVLVNGEFALCIDDCMGLDVRGGSSTFSAAY